MPGNHPDITVNYQFKNPAKAYEFAEQLKKAIADASPRDIIAKRLKIDGFYDVVTVTGVPKAKIKRFVGESFLDISYGAKEVENWTRPPKPEPLSPERIKEVKRTVKKMLDEIRNESSKKKAARLKGYAPINQRNPSPEQQEHSSNPARTALQRLQKKQQREQQAAQQNIRS